VIHLAAVSDYEVDQVVVDGQTVTIDARGKLDSGEAMELHLKRTPKLLPQLKSLGGADLVVIGFKLTNGATPAERRGAVLRVLDGTDFIVHNDLAEMGDGRHQATVFRPGQTGIEVVATVGDNGELAVTLEREILALLASR